MFRHQLTVPSISVQAEHKKVNTASKRPRQVPDQQIRDASDQYEEARLLLWALPPGSGVFYPSIHAAAIAIELYLKSLTSESVHELVKDEIDVARVYSKPEVANHFLEVIYDAIKPALKSDLDKQFRLSGVGRDPESLRDTLRRFRGLFMISRYPFEPQADIRGFDIHLLMQLSAFLNRFVSQQEPVDVIE
jgi:hypothetical protein